MNSWRNILGCSGAILLGALLAASASAATISREASDNATVQPTGPRTGTSGRAFFNIEGSANGNFASFGVADFSFAGTAPLTAGQSIAGATLKMIQSNAAFTETGPIGIYLTSQTGISIQDSNTTLNYAGANGASSVDSELLPLTLLAAATFTETTTGTVDSYSLSFGGPALTTLTNAINSGGTLRLVITPDAATTAATYAGATNATLAGPTLEVNVVPEPATVGLFVLGLVSAALGRRKIG